MNKYDLEGVTVAMNSIFDEICSIKVFDFLYQDDCINLEHEIIMMEEHNAATEEFRIKMFCAGWWWAIDLPYEALPGGGLIVNWQLDLDEETTFEQPWDYPKNGYNPSPTARERFYPPVPLTAQPSWRDDDSLREADGFNRDSYLIFHWDLWDLEEDGY